MKKEYSANSIKHLKFPENVRQRPGMYIGSIDRLSDGTNPAILQITKEVLDNAVDEVQSKHANDVYIEYNSKLQRITIADNGRGIPVEYHKDFKCSTVIGVFSNMHSSGKFDKDSYDQSVGTNGVGSKCTNALSKEFSVWTYRKGWHFVSFRQGILAAGLKKSKPRVCIENAGTVVEFVPDQSIIAGRLDFQKLYNTAQLLSFVLGIRITVVKDGKKKVLFSKAGIAGYLPLLCKEKKLEPDFANVITINKDSVNLAIGFIDADVQILRSFVNTSITESGTHVKGLQAAIFGAFKQVYKNRAFDYTDIVAGSAVVFNKGVKDVRFASQTKERLVTKEAEQETFNIVYPELVKWIKRNKTYCDELVQKAEKLKLLRSKSSNDRAVLKALKGKRGKSDLPPAKKFAESTTKNPEERILYIVEGNSAKGPCVSIRDPRIHEVLALRGKIMNVLRGKKEVFESEEVVNILKAVGYNESGKWRVGKVIVFCDKDPDGSQISALVLAVLMTLCPQLLREGRVYIVDAPLFVGKTATHDYYANSLGDLYRQSKSIKSITRIKGWGECPLNVLKKAAFSDESKLIKIEYSDIDKKKVYEIMGSNVAERKALLELLK